MKKNASYRLDIIPGFVIALLALAYLSQIPNIQVFEGLGSTPLTNHFAPLLWGSVLLVLALWLIIRGFRKRNAFLKAGGSPEELDILGGIWEKREVVASFTLLIFYVGLMGTVGFVPMTFVYLVLQILLLTPSEKKKKAILPAAVTAAVVSCFLFYVFRYTLNVLLPVGLLSRFGF